MDTLSTTFHALSDPTRRAILAHLAHGPQNVATLARPFEISLPAISRHLKVLDQADLITRERCAQTIYCHINADRLKSATEWLETYSQFWNGSFDRLEKLLEKPENSPPKNLAKKKT